MFRVTQSLLDRGAVDFRPLPNWIGFGGEAAADPVTGEVRQFAKFGLGQSLAALPGVALGRMLAPVVPEAERGLFDTPFDVPTGFDPARVFPGENPLRWRWDDWSAAGWPNAFETFAASLTNAVLMAAVIAVLFSIACELGYALRPALGMALVAGLATPLLVYAKTFFSEPLAALALLCFFGLAIRASRLERGTYGFAASGFALGIAILAKIAHLVLVPPSILLIAALVWRREKSFRETADAHHRVLAGTAFLLGLGVPLAMIAGYNFVRFGTVFETGYAGEASRWTTPFLEGFLGLLVSPGRGLLVFAPVLLVALAVLPRFARRHLLEAGFVALSFAVLLCFYARWYMWEGGWCWGPRFLVPVLPFLLIPLASAFSRDAPRIVQSLVWPTIGASAVIAISGASVNFIDFHNYVRLEYAYRAAEYAAAGQSGYYDLVRWDWRFSPIVRWWQFPVKDFFLLPHAIARPGFVLALYGLCTAGLVVSVARVACLVRGLAIADATSEARDSP
jgi:hypothetical protein